MLECFVEDDVSALEVFDGDSVRRVLDNALQELLALGERRRGAPQPSEEIADQNPGADKHHCTDVLGFGWFENDVGRLNEEPPYEGGRKHGGDDTALESSEPGAGDHGRREQRIPPRCAEENHKGEDNERWKERPDK